MSAADVQLPAPPKSRLRELKKILVRSLEVVANEGLVRFSEQAIDKMRRREFRIVELPCGPAMSAISHDVSQADLSRSEISNAKSRIARFSHRPKMSVITAVYDTDGGWLTEALESVRGQFYDNWELCICDNGATMPHVRAILDEAARKDSRVRLIRFDRNLGVAAGLQAALSLASGEFIGLLDHEDILYPDALSEAVSLLNQDPELDYIYSDEDKIGENGLSSEPFFKPDWSPELILCGCYTRHLSVFRKSLVDELGGFRAEYEGSHDWDLILRVTEKSNRIGHVRKVLYGSRKSLGPTAFSKDLDLRAYDNARRALVDAIRRRNIAAVVEDGLFQGTFRVRRKIVGTPFVSIIIPSAKVELLRKCIASLLSVTHYENFEIVIINGTKTAGIEAKLPKFSRYKILEDPHPERFNFSMINNTGARAAAGEYLAFLNDDMDFFQGGWLEAMLEHAQNPEVGAVGAKLLYPDGTVQHAGVVIGLSRGKAGHYEGIVRGYFGLADVVRDCAAVTAACMMTRRDIFLKLGGFNERLGHSWQDVDYCLRVLRIGLRVVYTPYAQLYHVTGGTRGRVDQSPDEIKAAQSFRKKWKNVIDKGDPYYNPNLSLEFAYTPKDELTNPMQLLICIYLSRPDLRKAFPEAARRDFKRLVEWAVTSGITIDSSRPLLEPFANSFRSIIQRMAT